MLHPDTEIRFVSEELGVGVFATKLIRKGTITWVLDDLDLQLDEDYVSALDPLRKKIILRYAFVGDRGKYVLCWDHGRYVNHSCNPNMVSTPYGFELASRDILPREELRCDYASLGMDAPSEWAKEHDSGRRRVLSADYLYLHRQWDKIAREAFQRFNLVSQPLRYLIRPEFVDKVSAMAAGREGPRSVLSVPAVSSLYAKR